MYFRLDHGKPAALHNIDSVTLLMRLEGYEAKTSNPSTPFEPPKTPPGCQHFCMVIHYSAWQTGQVN